MDVFAYDREITGAYVTYRWKRSRPPTGDPRIARPPRPKLSLLAIALTATALAPSAALADGVAEPARPPVLRRAAAGPARERAGALW